MDASPLVPEARDWLFLDTLAVMGQARAECGREDLGLSLEEKSQCPAVSRVTAEPTSLPLRLPQSHLAALATLPEPPHHP